MLYAAFKFKSRKTLRIYFFLRITQQKRLIKIQFAHISKSYLKFWHLPELSHGVYRGINPPQKHPPPSFLPSPLQIVQAPLFRQFPLNFVFCDPTPLKIGEPP